jgi:hypothetical protein
MACKTVCTSTTVVSPDTLSATPSVSSAIKTPDSESPGPSASLVVSEETQKAQKGNPDAPEPVLEGSICWSIPLITSVAQTLEQ